MKLTPSGFYDIEPDYLFRERATSDHDVILHSSAANVRLSGIQSYVSDRTIDRSQGAKNPFHVMRTFSIIVNKILDIEKGRLTFYE